LRIFSGGAVTGYIFFFQYYPAKNQLKQVDKLRNLPYWLWKRTLKRKLMKLTNLDYGDVF
jgi:hypothetical protein